MCGEESGLNAKGMELSDVFTSEEIAVGLKLLKSGKAPGSDKFSHNFYIMLAYQQLSSAESSY